MIFLDSKIALKGPNMALLIKIRIESAHMDISVRILGYFLGDPKSTKIFNAEISRKIFFP